MRDIKNKRNIIFIGGIHGVGKTTICKNISKSLNIEHYSSIDLIKNIKSTYINKDKKVKDISGNQNTLLQAIDIYLDESMSLLDGHFCLLDEFGSIKEISNEIFKEINIIKIIILVDSPEKIVERLRNRDSNKCSLDFIKEFQKREIEYGKLISEELNINLDIINLSENNNYIQKFKDIIKEYLI